MRVVIVSIPMIIGTGILYFRGDQGLAAVILGAYVLGLFVGQRK